MGGRLRMIRYFKLPRDALIARISGLFKLECGVEVVIVMGYNPRFSYFSHYVITPMYEMIDENGALAKLIQRVDSTMTTVKLKPTDVKSWRDMDLHLTNVARYYEVTWL